MAKTHHPTWEPERHSFDRAHDYRMDLWQEKEDGRGMNKMRILPSLVYIKGCNEDDHVIIIREKWQTGVITRSNNFYSLQKFL